MMTKCGLKNFIRFLKYLKPYWKKEILLWFLTFATASLSLVNPYLSKLVIDKAYAPRDLKIFIKLLLFGALLFIINSLFTSLSQYLKGYVDLKVEFDLQKTVFKKFENLPYIFFQKRTIGEYIFQLANHASQVASFITNLIPELAYTIPKFLFIFIILLAMNWKMTIFICISMSFLSIPPLLVNRRLMKKIEEQFNTSQNLYGAVNETLSNIQLVKVFGKERTHIKNYVKILIHNIRVHAALTKLELFSSFLESWANRLLLGLITVYGSYSIIKGQMSLGSFTAIMLYINQLLSLQGYLIGLFGRLNTWNISIGRLSEILDSWPQESEDKNAKKFLFPSGEIKFEDVSFSYYPERKVIQQLSFKIKGGTMIGLVGRSGCGKTTLVSLMVKLYQILQGRILIDGQDVNLIKNKSLREQIGMALQKPILWNDTIRSNIIYAHPKASDQDILRAAQISCSYDFIKNLPQGFDTVVGEGAVKLSEGQKQRVALARAIIKNPKILIIDEGMSSLDSQTEDNIIDNIKRELKDTTIIVVSHRLSTIKKMNLVYFLEAADKISVGYHEQLVQENPAYGELFASQIEEEKIIAQV